jgi:hypothetical protein
MKPVRILNVERRAVANPFKGKVIRILRLNQEVTVSSEQRVRGCEKS